MDTTSIIILSVFVLFLLIDPVQKLIENIRLKKILHDNKDLLNNIDLDNYAFEIHTLENKLENIKSYKPEELHLIFNNKKFKKSEILSELNKKYPIKKEIKDVLFK